MKFKISNPTHLVPEGNYDAKVIKVDSARIYQKNTLILWFEILNGDYNGSIIKGFLNAQYEVITRNTKLFQWYEKVIGHELDENEEIDTDNFFNRALKVSVKNKVSRKTKNEFSNVSEILHLISEI